MDNIKWLSFHSGYDFGYLLKLLTDQNLPQDENDFFESLRLYFPTVYDVKVNINFFSFLLYFPYNRRNLMLRHSFPHFPQFLRHCMWSGAHQCCFVLLREQGNENS